MGRMVLFFLVLNVGVSTTIAQPEFVRPETREKLIAGSVYPILMNRPAAEGVYTLWRNNTCLGALVGRQEGQFILRWEVGFVKDKDGKPVLVPPGEHTLVYAIGGRIVATSPPFILEP